MKSNTLRCTTSEDFIGWHLHAGSELAIEPRGIDAIHRLTDPRGLRSKDKFPSKGRASDLMRSKRPLILKLLQKLRLEFDIPAEVLIAPYRYAEENR